METAFKSRAQGALKKAGMINQLKAADVSRKYDAYEKSIMSVFGGVMRTFKVARTKLVDLVKRQGPGPDNDPNDEDVKQRMLLEGFVFLPKTEDQIQSSVMAILDKATEKAMDFIYKSLTDIQNENKSLKDQLANSLDSKERNQNQLNAYRSELQNLRELNHKLNVDNDYLRKRLATRDQAVGDIRKAYLTEVIMVKQQMTDMALKNFRKAHPDIDILSCFEANMLPGVTKDDIDTPRVKQALNPMTPRTPRPQTAREVPAARRRFVGAGKATTITAQSQSGSEQSVAQPRTEGFSAKLQKTVIKARAVPSLSTTQLNTNEEDPEVEGAEEEDLEAAAIPDWDTGVCKYSCPKCSEDVTFMRDEAIMKLENEKRLLVASMLQNAKDKVVLREEARQYFQDKIDELEGIIADLRKQLKQMGLRIEKMASQNDKFGALLDWVAKFSAFCINSGITTFEEWKESESQQQLGHTLGAETHGEFVAQVKSMLELDEKKVARSLAAVIHKVVMRDAFPPVWAELLNLMDPMPALSKLNKIFGNELQGLVDIILDNFSGPQGFADLEALIKSDAFKWLHGLIGDEKYEEFLRRLRGEKPKEAPRLPPSNDVPKAYRVDVYVSNMLCKGENADTALIQVQQVIYHNFNLLRRIFVFYCSVGVSSAEKGIAITLNQWTKFARDAKFDSSMSKSMVTTIFALSNEERDEGDNLAQDDDNPDNAFLFGEFCDGLVRSAKCMYHPKHGKTLVDCFQHLIKHNLKKVSKAKCPLSVDELQASDIRAAVKKYAPKLRRIYKYYSGQNMGSTAAMDAADELDCKEMFQLLKDTKAFGPTLTCAKYLHSFFLTIWGELSGKDTEPDPAMVTGCDQDANADFADFCNIMVRVSQMHVQDKGKTVTPAAEKFQIFLENTIFPTAKKSIT